MGVEKMGVGFKRFVVLALIATVGAGCGKNKGDEKFTEISCGASDQFASYMNPMDSTVVQTISIDSAFSSDEVTKIEAAVATWNAESNREFGRDIFRTQVLGISASSVPESGQDCGFPGAQGAFSIVKVTNQSTWTSLGFSSNNPGVTIRCAQGLAYATKQVVLLNTANMATMPEIFQNVILHELGHSIGLDHSCDSANAGKPGFAGCAAAGTDPSYGKAVMYPYVNPADVRNELRPNDQQRATCALNYQP
jgi:hypothetical protein